MNKWDLLYCTSIQNSINITYHVCRPRKETHNHVIYVEKWLTRFSSIFYKNCSGKQAGEMLQGVKTLYM